jgi:SP family general alpha glucoside:H+ symporter-like MFS transporter
MERADEIKAEKDIGVEHLNDMGDVAPKASDQALAAQSAVAAEKSMGLIASARLYPKAILFSCIMSLGIVMVGLPKSALRRPRLTKQEGYDTSLLGSFYAQPAFQLHFGNRIAADGTHQISAPWQAGLSNGAAVGEIIGLMLAGWICDRFGYKKTLSGALVFLIGAIFICFFAVNLPMLFAGEVLCGLPWVAFLTCPTKADDSRWGAFQTLTVSYAAVSRILSLRALF